MKKENILLLVMLMFSLSSIAQQKGRARRNTNSLASESTVQPVSSVTANGALITHSMKEYQKTTQGTKRKEEYGKYFGDAKNGEVKKHIKYQDGSGLNLTLTKHPAYGDQATSIKASINKKDKSEKVSDGKGGDWNCTTDHVSLTANSTTFLNNDYSGQASHIYPGAIYTFEDFYNGSYKEQTGQRNPITIVSDNHNIKGSASVTIKDPNMATIRNAIDQLFRESVGPAADESLTYQIYETSNSADESIKISGGASGYGASLSAGYSNGSQSHTLNLTIDAIKTLFSINTIPPDNGFFTDSKTESTPNLMVMGEVSYGVRVLANLTVNFASDKEAEDFKASYSGFGVSANVAFDKISKSKSVNSTINCYVVGGPGNATLSFDKKDLEKEIQKIMQGATYKDAMPVKYEFYDMGGDVIGSNSATDEFSVRQCTPGKNDPRLERVYVTFATGGDNKNQNDNYSMYLYPGNEKIVRDNPANGAIFDLGSGWNSPEYKENTTYTFEMGSINKHATLSEITKYGGAITMQVSPDNGSDVWKITNMNVTLTFEGDTGKGHTITFTNVVMDTDNNNFQTFYFDGTFSPRK